MGTKTIDIRDDVYERLQARKRADESLSDLVNRLLDETTVDWREGFGTLSEGEADELEKFVEDSRDQLGEGLSARQREALDELTDGETEDETA
ncbi:antitoxin VapB family protein [Natribaculum luteum]|uniref:Antitoxin VapB family protein n=1 Tax=Natribaculum luteum TaxID=1586232 RepID=A0ABD5P0S0_9EURY|nr:antitoxin VapB family protein [Natribaculum luteum]